MLILLPVVDHLHISILFNPQLTNNDIVNTTCGICPCVGFIVPGGKKTKTVWHNVHFQNGNRKGDRRIGKRINIDTGNIFFLKTASSSYLGSSSVIVPFGSASTLLPQNLSLG